MSDVAEAGDSSGRKRILQRGLGKDEEGEGV